MRITKYAHVNREGEVVARYDTLEGATIVAEVLGQRVAVVAETYDFVDSELVWTPDGSTTWPPEEDPVTVDLGYGGEPCGDLDEEGS